MTKASASALKNVKWRKVSAPSSWHPKDGEELTGYYAGRTKRDGSFGPYEVVLVLVPYKGTFMVSGTKIMQLVDAAMIGRGDAVRIVYLGPKDIGEGRSMKNFELYVGEADAAEDLPEISPS